MKVKNFIISGVTLWIFQSLCLGNPLSPLSKDMSESSSDAKSNAAEDAEGLDTLLKILKQVQENYVTPVKRKDLYMKAYEGTLSSFDPHSAYLSPQDYKEFCEHTSGKFSGLGMEVTMENGLILVIAPIDDTPAARAGIKSKDFIIAINGKLVSGMTLMDAVKLMRGPAGTKVNLLIKREGEKKPIAISLMRQIIDIQSVKWRVENDIGYIRISTFDENTVSRLRKAIDDIQKKTGTHLKGFVVDLRDNPGGLLDQVVDAVNFFIEDGVIVSTKGQKREHFSVKRAVAQNCILKDIPVVVIVNGGSASASEIFASALQDHGRALIVGEQTFGKGSVQTILPLPNGGATRLTVARFYGPLGKPIQGEGVKPDIEVPPYNLGNPEINKPAQAFQIREKNLAGTLSSEGKSSPNDSNLPKDSHLSLQKSNNAIDDYQMKAALDAVLILHKMIYTKKGSIKPQPRIP